MVALSIKSKLCNVQTPQPQRTRINLHYSRMKANPTLTHIAQVLGSSCSTIRREVNRGRGHRGYRAEQACVKTTELPHGSRNTRRIPSWVLRKVQFYLKVRWVSEQIANELPLSHELFYLYVYADRAKGGRLHKDLRSQKPRRRRCLSGYDRRGQIPKQRTNGERPAHIKARKQVVKRLQRNHECADSSVSAKVNGPIFL